MKSISACIKSGRFLFGKPVAMVSLVLTLLLGAPGCQGTIYNRGGYERIQYEQLPDGTFKILIERCEGGYDVHFKTRSCPVSGF